MKMPIPDDWDGVSYCCYSIKWPQSELWEAILLGQVTEAGRGFFWDERTGNVVIASMAIRETFDYNFDLRSCIMSCDDAGLLAIANSINALALAQGGGLNASCCGSGSGTVGQGDGPPPYNPIEQGDPETDPPPEGFESWTGFNENKCAVAAHIVATLIGDWDRMRVINLVGLTITTLLPILIGLILTPIPGDELAVIGGLLIATLAIGAGMIAAVRQVLADNEHDLVCSLYNGLSALGAEQQFEAKFSEVWDASGFGGGIYTFSAKAAIGAMVTSAVTNQLFELNTAIDLDSADCSDCSEGCLGHFGFDGTSGTIEAGDPNEGEFTLGLVLIGGIYRTDLSYLLEPDVVTPCCKTLEYVSSSGLTPQGGGAPYLFTLYDELGAIMYEGDAPPGDMGSVSSLSVRSTTDGTVTWIVSDDEC